MLLIYNETALQQTISKTQISLHFVGMAGREGCAGAGRRSNENLAYNERGDNICGFLFGSLYAPPFQYMTPKRYNLLFSSTLFRLCQYPCLQTRGNNLDRVASFEMHRFLLGPAMFNFHNVHVAAIIRVQGKRIPQKWICQKWICP